MKRQLAISIVFAVALWAKDDKTADDLARLKEAGEVLNEVMGAPDDAIPGELLARAECVLIVPGLKKGGVGISGSFGRGAASCRRDEGAGPWGSPSMLTIRGGGFGLQLGVQSSDMILLVMNRKGIDHLLKSKFKLGADASATAGPKGRGAAVATDALMHAEILTYARSRGLFAGVSLEGAVVSTDGDANQRLYGRRVIAKDLLIDGKHGLPDGARPLIDALTRHAPRNVSAPKK